MYAAPSDNTIRILQGRNFEGENIVAKRRKPAEEMSGLTAQTMEQARNAVDTYFDYLKRTVSEQRPLVEQSMVRNLKAAQEANACRDT